MAAALPMRFGAGRRPAPRWLAVTSVELVLRLRDTNVPILAAGAAAACVLLTPSVDANYAVITFGGMKAAMSADTSLVAAGLVLNLVMFPVYSLTLGVGCARDRTLGTGVMMASSPVDAISVIGGRMAANALVVVLFSAVAMALVSVALAARETALPNAFSIAAYFLIVVPAGLCALPVAALLDRCFGQQESAKAAAIIAVWSTLMICSLLAWPDAFGFDFLRQNAPHGTASDFSVGLVGAAEMSRIPWTVVQLTTTFTAARVELMATVIFTCAFACVAARFGWIQAMTRVVAGPTASAAAAVLPAAHIARVRPSSVGVVPAVWIVGRQWFKGTKAAGGMFAVALAISLVAPSPRPALAAALLIPLAIVNSRRISGATEVRQFEQSTAALWRPSPLLFTALVLAAVTAIPVIPILARMSPLRSGHVLVSITVAALWLTWSCAAIARPLLGISVFTLAWYLECFSDLPASVDLLGVRTTTPVSFAGAVGLSLVLLVQVIRKDGHDSRS